MESIYMGFDLGSTQCAGAARVNLDGLLGTEEFLASEGMSLPL